MRCRFKCYQVKLVRDAKRKTDTRDRLAQRFKGKYLKEGLGKREAENKLMHAGSFPGDFRISTYDAEGIMKVTLTVCIPRNKFCHFKIQFADDAPANVCAQIKAGLKQKLCCTSTAVQQHVRSLKWRCRCNHTTMPYVCSCVADPALIRLRCFGGGHMARSCVYVRTQVESRPDTLCALHEPFSFLNPISIASYVLPVAC